MNDLGRSALYYAEHFGWAVFPLHSVRGGKCSCGRPDCGNAGKHPRTKHGLKDATKDAAQITAWWEEWPDANVGVATGLASGFVAVDVDPRNGGEDTLERLEDEYGKLPPTVEAKTGGGGRHLLFKRPAAARMRCGKLGPGVDFKADGGYIVASPSVHASGRVYAWEASSRPGEVELAELPMWVAPAREGKPPPKTKPGADPEKSFLGFAFGAAGMLGKRIDDQRMSVICPWASDHTTGGDGDTSTVLFAPSLGRTLGWFHCSHSHCQGKGIEAVLAALPAEAVEAAEREYPKKQAETRYDPTAGWRFARGDHADLAKAALAVLGPAPLTYDEGEFWRYKSTGVWERLPLAFIEHTVASFAGAPVGNGKSEKPLKVTAGSVTGAAHLARNELASLPGRIPFIAGAGGVAFRNGIASVVDGIVRLEQHSPERMCRWAYPFDYAPAPTPLLDAFLDILFGDVSEEERSLRIMVLQEFAGACLVGQATRFQTCLLLLGPGGNGKSELLRVLRGLFPPGSAVSLPPQKWGERFQLARLVGALANFVDEVPERDITNGEVFKSVVTGEPNHVERKNKDPFEFAPRAGHIFSANAPPGTADQTEGFFRRWAFVLLTRPIDRLAERQLEAGKAILAGELPGVVTWALAGAARLQQQGAYTASEQSKRVVSEWRDEASPIRLFLLDRPANDRAPAQSFYDSYVSWCRSNGHSPMSSTKFGRSVLSTGWYARERRECGSVYSRRVTVQ